MHRSVRCWGKSRRLSSPRISGSTTAISAPRASCSGLPAVEGFFLVRQHAATLTYTLVGKRKDRGRRETDQVFEQTLRATNNEGEVLFLRRVTVVLDKPTRDGDTELHLLTNCAGQARAVPRRRSPV